MDEMSVVELQERRLALLQEIALAADEIRMIDTRLQRSHDVPPVEAGEAAQETPSPMPYFP